MNQTEQAELMTRAEFARSQGWNASYVTKLGKQGRLVMTEDGKKVHVAQTLEVIRRSSDPSAEGVRARHERDRKLRSVGPRGTASTRKPGGEGEAAAPVSSYWEAKSRREHFQALISEAEYRKQCGELVDRSRVEAAAAKAGRMLRDAVMGLPARLGPELAAMTDAFGIEKHVAAALRQALDDVANKAASDLQEVLG